MTSAWWRGRGPVAIVVLAAVALYTGDGLIRYATFHAPAYDLGFFDQLTANLGAGRGWTSSFVGYDFRGQHWEPILLVWAQLYRLVQTPVWLLLVNGIALGLAPLAAWRLGRAWFGVGSAIPLVAALATALSPLVLRTAGFDYHSEALTPALTLLALEAATRRRWLAVAAACAVLVILKEDGFLVVAGIGWLLWRVERRRAWLGLCAAAIAGFVLIVGVYMPAVRGGHASDLLARYSYLGATGHASTPLAVLTGMAAHPATWAAHLLSAAPLEGLAVALVPLALLPLLSGTALLALVPVLGLALLSSDPLQSALHLQYGAQAFALLLACAMLGLRRVRSVSWAGAPRLTRAAQALGVTVVAAAAAIAVNPVSRATDAGGATRITAVEAVLGRVPRAAPVSASTDLVAHLSERPAVREFPDVGGARWVVIDATGAPSARSVAAGYPTALAQLHRDFHVVVSDAGVSVWERS